MMRILRTLATAVALSTIAGAALAGTAHADPLLLNGSYNEINGDALDVWTFATNCGPGGCSGTVASNKGWTSPATPTGDRWTFTVSKPGAITCADGSIQPAVVSMSVDPATLAGVMSSDSNYGCPGGTVTQTPFQLRQVG